MQQGGSDRIAMHCALQPHLKRRLLSAKLKDILRHVPEQSCTIVSATINTGTKRSILDVAETLILALIPVRSARKSHSAHEELITVVVLRYEPHVLQDSRILVV